MPDHLKDPEILMSLLAFFVAAVFAVHLVLARQRAHKERMAVLGLVQTMVDEAFDAADCLITDPDTPDSIRDMVQLFNDGVGKRGLALAYFTYEQRKAKGLIRGGLSEEYKAGVEALAADRKDLLDKLLIFVAKMKLITPLRWKETQALGLASMDDILSHLPDSREIDQIEKISEEIILARPSRVAYKNELVAA